MSEEKQSVLIVDRDRMASLISTMLAPKYATDVAFSGVKAVHKLSEHVPSAIIADVDIPGSGISLAELIGISPRYRAVPVILMSTNPSPDMVLRARDAGANSYLAKPFRPSEIQRRVEAVLSLPAPVKARAIRERVKRIEGLPAFPEAHSEILKLARSEDSTSEALAEKIQIDPGLLATVFKLANASCFGFQRKIDSLPLAVTLLGFEAIANLVVSVQVFQELGDYTEGGGLDLHGFWKHSVGTAFVARSLAQKRHVGGELAFLSGMVHDLGQVVLDRCFADYYRPVKTWVEEEKVSLLHAEQRMLGLTHADVGGQLAVEWKLPDALMLCMRYHHRPLNAPEQQELVTLVYMADLICRQLGYGNGGDGVVPEMDERVLLRLSLGRRGFELLKKAAEQDLGEADEFLAALCG